MTWIAMIRFLLLSIPLTYAFECYTGSQMHAQQCASSYCVKQIFGMDTVRYCDGAGVQSVCKAYKVVNTCEMVPNVGFICCCDSDLCNPAVQDHYSSLFLLIPLLLFLF